MLNVLYELSTALILILALRAGVMLTGVDTKVAVGRQRIPWVAMALTAIALIGVTLQYTWAGAFDALADLPGRAGWWRPFTAVFLQGGPAGAAWNVITLLVAAALAEWFWGRLGAALLFGFGMVGPSLVGSVLLSASTQTNLAADPRNFVGSSGATYLLAGTLVGALLMRTLLARPVRRSGIGLPLAHIVVALFAWFALANAHGLVSFFGVVIGAGLGALVGRRARAAGQRSGRTLAAALPRVFGAPGSADSGVWPAASRAARSTVSR